MSGQTAQKVGVRGATVYGAPVARVQARKNLAESKKRLKLMSKLDIDKFNSGRKPKFVEFA